MEMLTYRTPLSAGVVRSAQESEVEALAAGGRPVHTGIAIFTPSVHLEGNLNIKVRVDKRIVAALNAPRAFKGRVRNIENIGKTSQELAELWNQEHPHDPVQNYESFAFLPEPVSSQGEAAEFLALHCQ